MGNCLRRDKDPAVEEEKADDLKPQPLHILSKEEERWERESNKVEKIKVVVTKQELRQILGHERGINSVEHLVHVLKHRGRNYISKVHVQEDDKKGGCDDGKWRPKLESIPENYY